MKIGVSSFLTDYSIDVVTLATRAEELGFDSLWVPEHPIIPVERTQKAPGGQHRRGRCRRSTSTLWTRT